jgi:hypothetical protein
MESLPEPSCGWINTWALRASTIGHDPLASSPNPLLGVGHDPLASSPKPLLGDGPQRANSCKMVIPECRSPPYSTDDERERLHDLAIVSSLPMAHSVPVHEINRAFFPGLDK